MLPIDVLVNVNGRKEGQEESLGNDGWHIRLVAPNLYIDEKNFHEAYFLLRLFVKS